MSRLPNLGEGEEYELTGYAQRLYDVEGDRKIIGWRLECFERLGFDYHDSMAMALRRDIDREQVERAVKGGAELKHVLEAFL